MPTHYSCSTCGLAVIVLPTAVVRACRCGSAIVASISATAKGHGGVKVGGKPAA